MGTKNLALEVIANELIAIRKTLQDIAYIMDQRWH